MLPPYHGPQSLALFQAGVHICPILRFPAAFPHAHHRHRTGPSAPFVKHVLLTPQNLASAWRAHPCSLERPVFQPLRSGLQVTCSSSCLVTELTPSLFLLISIVFLCSPYPWPKLLCQFTLMWLVSSSPRREALNSEFSCFTLWCSSWDLVWCPMV